MHHEVYLYLNTIFEYLNWLHEVKSPPYNMAIRIFYLQWNAILRLGTIAQIKPSSFQSLSKEHKKWKIRLHLVQLKNKGVTLCLFAFSVNVYFAALCLVLWKKNGEKSPNLCVYTITYIQEKQHFINMCQSFLGQSADFQGIPHLVLREVHATHVNPTRQH